MAGSRINFRVDAQAEGSQARATTFETAHNRVTTPVFMPVGTQASVKAQSREALLESGSQVLLANTYHLLLRPGIEVFKRLGGIHKLMNWPRSVLTDSGGYQIFSLPNSRSLTEEGAVFQSYVDGQTILLSPELSIEAQVAIGSDIMMVLDQCVPGTADEATASAALGLTHRWAARSLEARGDSPQAMFGIVQGAIFKDLRRESALHLAAMPFDGFAIGGLAVGETKDERQDMCEFTARLMPKDKPRYLMGVGTPLDILEAVHRGIDMFDCIIPTALAKHGGAYTSRGYVQLRRAVHKFSEEPVDPACACPTCRDYSRAYLHHLTKTQEMMGWQLLGQHNIHFFHQLMRDIRARILDGTFLAFYRARREELALFDIDNPSPDPGRKIVVPRRLGDYEIHIAREGFGSILHVRSGEIMHSRTAPMDEAQNLYIEQSRLGERLELSPGEDRAAARPLVVWDVGLGAAANAMAAVRCYEQLGSQRPLRGLRVISFENDLDSLRLACSSLKHFPYLRHGAPQRLLSAGAWKSQRHPGLAWRLVEGDFSLTLGEADGPPDLIFFDLFSGRTNGEAWTLSAFRRLFKACARHDTELFTYSASTAGRVAMLGAGFFVAKGRVTDERYESSIAFTPGALEKGAASRHKLLGLEWLTRWKRSGVKFPPELAEGEYPGFEQLILQHPQFSDL